MLTTSGLICLATNALFGWLVLVLCQVWMITPHQTY